MSRYAKGVDGVEHFYQPEDLFKYAGEQFDVRVTILDEPPEQGLWVTVPADRIGSPIAELLDQQVIGQDPKQTEFIRDNLLDLDESPHLSDALDKAAAVWHRYREEESGLGLSINDGDDDVAFEDTARAHMSTCVWDNGEYDYMLLDLVLEPSELTLAGMLGERKREFFQWLQGTVALYKLDTDEAAERQLRKRKDLADAREQLFFHNLVTEGARGKLEISQQGRRSIGRLMEEQDELISRYDVFRDVVTRHGDDDKAKFDFSTLSGVDYRVSVYEHLKIDPFRSVFLLTLLSGELDDDLKGKEWVNRLTDERFYEEILKAAVDRAELSDGELAELVKEGEQYLARTAALRERARYSENVLSRTGTIEAFPRPSAKKDNEEARKGNGKDASEELEPKARTGTLPAAVAKGPSIPKRRRPFKKAKARASTLPPPPPTTEPTKKKEDPIDDADAAAEREVDEALGDDDREADLREAERDLDAMLESDDGERDKGDQRRKKSKKRKGFRRNS